MTLLYKQRILLSILLVNFSLLTACGHKNPLLNDQMTYFMKENFFLRGPNFPIEQCADYYSSAKQNTELKKKCGQWTQEYYRLLINMHSIPSNTTLEDLRDPAFWKQVKATNVFGNKK